MSEQYKYEPIFGDQTLFDSAPEDAVSVRYGKSEYIFDSEEIKATTGQLRDVPVVAMRRIIRTPTWTVEDQKAGKLPEVGCRVSFCHKFNTNWRAGEIKYIDDQVAFIKTDDNDRPFIYEVDRVEFKPIESPEEKAARLREEWIDNACSFICFYDIGRVDAIKSLEITYDKLKSGELPPVQAKDGA